MYLIGGCYSFLLSVVTTTRTGQTDSTAAVPNGPTIHTTQMDYQRERGSYQRQPEFQSHFHHLRLHTPHRCPLSNCLWFRAAKTLIKLKSESIVVSSWWWWLLPGQGDVH